MSSHQSQNSVAPATALHSTAEVSSSATLWPKKTPELMSLPVELWLQILRPLLVLLFDPKRVTRRYKLTQVVDQGDVSQSKMPSPHARHIQSLPEARNEISSSGAELNTQLLRVCRALDEEGHLLIAENHLVKISLPAPIRPRDAAAWNMILWQLPDAIETSETPIIGINVYAADDTAAPEMDQPRSHYLLEMRDVHFVIRYLLRICHALNPGNLNDTRLRTVIAVAIRRTHVTGLCDTTNAAARLFLNPIFPLLKGMIRFVGCVGKGPLPDYGSLREFVNSLRRSNSRLRTSQVLSQILGATNASRFQPPPGRPRWEYWTGQTVLGKSA